MGEKEGSSDINARGSTQAPIGLHQRQLFRALMVNFDQP
jgi:hypothetical protein